MGKHFAKKIKKLAQACSLVCHHRQSSRTLAHRILFLTRYLDLLKDRGTMMIKMRIAILSRLVRGASLSACPNPGRNMSIPIFKIEKLDPILGSDHIFKKNLFRFSVRWQALLPRRLWTMSSFLRLFRSLPTIKIIIILLDHTSAEILVNSIFTKIQPSTISFNHSYVTVDIVLFWIIVEVFDNGQRI